MRLLFVTYFFPPFMTSGAVRTGQTAKYLLEMGHDVRVVTADRQLCEFGLKLEVPRNHVVYTPWLGWRVMAAIKGESAHGIRDAAVQVISERRSSLALPAKRLARFAQRNVIYVPDDRIGWYPWAVRASLRIIRQHHIDLVYASGGPFTSLLVGATAARIAHVPWVGELRDLWSDNHYRDLSPWLRRLDEGLERMVLRSASGLVTMSEPWAGVLAKKFTMPVRVVYNGYEEHAEPPLSLPPNGGQSEILVIAHLGMLYGGKRDPSALFQAVRALGEDARRVRIDFYGPERELVSRLAKSAKIENCVRVLAGVSHAESLMIQSKSDILLLLMWDTPAEEGVMPGKLFEYLGARRPILAVGAGKGVAARLISNRQLGLASSDPVEIEAQLRSWMREKIVRGGLAPLPVDSAAEFSRIRQVRNLSDFLGEIQADRGL